MKFPRISTNQKHYQDLGSDRHQYGISVLVTQTSFCDGSNGDLAKRRLFSQDILSLVIGKKFFVVFIIDSVVMMLLLLSLLLLLFFTINVYLNFRFK